MARRRSPLLTASASSRERPLLHLVFPRWQGTGIHVSFGHRMPPMVLLVLAALARRSGWDVRVVDDNFEPLPQERPDVAALAVWTSLASRAYQLADGYRARGVPVVLGGVHPSLVPSEALRHADAVVGGEAETVLSTVLDDALAGRLQPLYQGPLCPMEDVPTVEEWADIVSSWPLTRYAPMNTLQTTRGCRFNCDFCSVIRINGRGSRHREPAQVVEELRVLKRVGQHLGRFAYVFFLDDDLAADLEYATELMEEMVRSQVGVTWGAQASIGLARDPDVVALAQRSGCRALFTGFESISRDSLVECNKKNRPSQYQELVGRLHEHGIAVEGGFIFGFDHDRPSVFRETVDAVDEIGVDTAHFSILTPYPGTHTYARMLADERITSFDWSRYNLYNAVFEPAHMTAEQLEAGLLQAYRDFYSRNRRCRRLLREARRRDPRFSAAFAAANHGYARHYRPGRMGGGAPYAASPADVADLAQASQAPAASAVTVALTTGRRRLAPATEAR